jgi:hypothetical protein
MLIAPGEVLICIVVRPENLDELGSFCAAEALDFITINRCRHLRSCRRLDGQLPASYGCV